MKKLKLAAVDIGARQPPGMKGARGRSHDSDKPCSRGDRSYHQGQTAGPIALIFEAPVAHFAWATAEGPSARNLPEERGSSMRRRPRRIKTSKLDFAALLRHHPIVQTLLDTEIGGSTSATAKSHSLSDCTAANHEDLR